ADPGPFTDNRDIDRGDGAAPLSDEIGGIAQEPVRPRGAPAAAAGRQLRPDVACPDRPEHGIGQGMKPDISVRMTREAHAVRDLDAAYPEMIPWGKGMDVEALPDANVALSGGDQALGGSEILRCRDLQIVLAAFNDQRSQ